MPPSSLDNEPIYRCPTELLRNLIRFDTTNPPGNEVACVQYIDKLLTDAGFETVLRAKEANRPNLITRLGGEGQCPATAHVWACRCGHHDKSGLEISPL